MNDSDRPERPGPDADAAEIAEWVEQDFGQAVAEGIANAGDEDDHGDQNVVIEVDICNHERNEVVGTLETNRNIDTENTALRDVFYQPTVTKELMSRSLTA
jgi:hypothetical protein